MPEPITSADSHVSERPNCYVDFIDAKFKERAPRVRHDEKRGDVFEVERGRQSIPWP